MHKDYSILMPAPGRTTARAGRLVAVLSLLAIAIEARADGGGCVYLTRDGRPVDFRAESLACIRGGRGPLTFDAALNAYRVHDANPGDPIHLSRVLREGEDRGDRLRFAFRPTDLSRDVRLEWIGGPLSGRVLTTRGKPAPGVPVVVILERAELPANVTAMEFMAQSRTDPNGRYELRDIPPGEYRVSIGCDRAQGGAYGAGPLDYLPRQDGRLTVRRDGASNDVPARLVALAPRLRISSPVEVEVRVQVEGDGGAGPAVEGSVLPGKPWVALLPDRDALEVEIRATALDAPTFFAWRRLGADDGLLAIELPSLREAAPLEIEVPGGERLPSGARWFLDLTPDLSDAKETRFELPFFSESWSLLPADGRLVLPHVLPGRYLVMLRPEPVAGQEERWASLCKEHSLTQRVEVGSEVRHVVLER